MGLDIRTLKHARREGPLRDASGEWCDEPMEDGRCACAVSSADFPDHLDGYEPGWYFGEDGHSFRAGSYSGYNRVRADLCRLALDVEPETVWTNPDRFKDQPIFPLIHFTDCDGAVGPVTSKRLADALDALAPRFAQMDEWSAQKAEDFRRAFREAADSDGLVIFT